MPTVLRLPGIEGCGDGLHYRSPLQAPIADFRVETPDSLSLDDLFEHWHHVDLRRSRRTVTNVRRVEKLAQLLVEDVQKIDGIWCLSIGDVPGAHGERQRFKNDDSCREPPLHPKVVKEGFLRYAACLSDVGVTRPFPEPASAMPILGGCPEATPGSDRTPR